MADAYKTPYLPAEPTPEERAEYVIMRLEQFIREGRKDETGMSFRKWQNMAKSEIAIAIAEAEMSQQVDELSSKRVLFVSAASLITIGFWGTAVSLHNVGYLVGGLVMGFAGFVMIATISGWRLRKWSEMRKAAKRRAILRRIEHLNRRIKRMERELEIEAEELDELLVKARKLRGRKPKGETSGLRVK